MSVPSLESVRDKWNGFAEAFSSNWTLLTSHSGYSLVVALQLAQAHNILEVGTGAGLGTQLCLFFKSKEAKLISIDLSTEFLRIAKERLGDADVEFQEGNGERLSFGDGQFDRYLANFVIHLTPDPVAMLKEARRVLKPGGMAGFTVWGRKEVSPHYTLTNVVAHEMDIDLNQGAGPQRSNFYLGENPEDLRKMALDAGFSKAFTWYQSAAFECWEPESWVDRSLESPNIKAAMAQIGEEKAAEYRKNLLAKVSAILEQGRPIQSENLFLLAIA